MAKSKSQERREAEMAKAAEEKNKHLSENPTEITDADILEVKHNTESSEERKQWFRGKGELLPLWAEGLDYPQAFMGSTFESNADGEKRLVDRRFFKLVEVTEENASE